MHKAFWVLRKELTEANNRCAGRATVEIRNRCARPEKRSAERKARKEKRGGGKKKHPHITEKLPCKFNLEKRKR